MQKTSIIIVVFTSIFFSQSLLAQPGIANFSLDENNITLEPNTNDGFFQIFGSLQYYTIDLLDYFGNVKQNLNANSTLAIVQSNTLPIGAYFIRIENNVVKTVSIEKIIAKQSDAIVMTGGWRLIDWYDVIPRDINNDGTASVDLFSQWNGCWKQSILELNDNQAGKIFYTGEPNNPRCPPNLETYDFANIPPWDVNNNYLEFIGDDFIDIYEIIELSSDLLVLKGSGFWTCCDASISYFTGGYLKFERVYY